MVRLEHAEWLAGQGETDRARELLEQARETFERLRAKPWLDRAAKLGRVEAVYGVASLGGSTDETIDRLRGRPDAV